MFENIIDQKLDNKNIPEFRTGDTVRIKILTKGQDSKKRKRSQTFEGIVISRKGYKGSSVWIYRFEYGVKMEMMFILFHPRVVSLEVTRYAKFRRAKMRECRKSLKGRPKIPASIPRREKYAKKK